MDVHRKSETSGWGRRLEVTWGSRRDHREYVVDEVGDDTNMKRKLVLDDRSE